MQPSNPLNEATPDSLNEIFSRNPLELSDQEVLLGVEELRRMRSKWVLGEAKAGKKPTEKTDIVNLDDLGI